ncbi:FAD-dependent oxidoreductase, partial [Actinophytocola sp.]|uniref:FAD-dependent oxidoreductase n=1 Tax=Actinophytocola sp. TaxID=1872138 RepID=UPI002D80E510
MTSVRAAVVGGGISGLVAAYRLRRLLGPAARITLIEQTDRLGGKLRTVELAGTRYDVGAEAFLNRRPEAVALATELGLAGDLVHPSGARSTVRAGGVTRPIPPRTVMGVPEGPEPVRALLSPDGLRAVAAEPTLPPVRLDGADAGLGALLRGRFGAELVDRLVDPLLGGVYAGTVDGLGLRATLPALAGALDAGATSLTQA